LRASLVALLDNIAHTRVDAPRTSGVCVAEPAVMEQVDVVAGDEADGFGSEVLDAAHVGVCGDGLERDPERFEAFVRCPDRAMPAERVATVKAGNAVGHRVSECKGR
jgi:hypothetical protein